MNKEQDTAVEGKKVPMELDELRAILDALDKAIGKGLTPVLRAKSTTVNGVTEETSNRELPHWRQK